VVNNQRQINLVFAALADPTRRKIIERLSTGKEVRVTTLARPFRMSLPAFSRHLRTLEDARLIRRRRAGRLHLISAQAEGLRQAREWILRYAEGWDASFDALDELLKKDQQKGKEP
jgi:DNA-binding transcriptional ArsR family regulator